MRWWMTSVTQWTWIWANSGKQWRTGKPGVLKSMGLQGVGHDLGIEQEVVARVLKQGLVGIWNSWIVTKTDIETMKLQLIMTKSHSSDWTATTIIQETLPTPLVVGTVMPAQKSSTGQKLSSPQILMVVIVDNSQLSTHSWWLLLAKICSLILSHTILKGQPHPMRGLCERNEGWTSSYPCRKDCAGSKAPLQTEAFVNTAPEVTVCFSLLLLLLAPYKCWS